MSASGTPESDGRRRSRNPLDWSRTDKVLLLSVAILGLVVWGWFTLIYLGRHPSAAPYLRLDVLERAEPVITHVWLPLWTALAVTALAVRRRWPESRLLVHLLGVSYVATIAWASHLVGTHTTPTATTALMAAAVVGLSLFREEPMGAYVVLALLALAGVTVLEQSGLVPYAPLLHTLPLRDGRLPTPWLLSQGSFLVGQLAVALALVYLVVLHWEERDGQLARGTDELGRTNLLISRYVASQLAKQILAGEHLAAERHERRRLTFFFSDIRDFTVIADRMEPEDLSELLNEYLSEMVAIAERHGATIDKFIGDAILAFFGAPQSMPDGEQALRAVRMAAEMQQRIDALGAKWRANAVEHSIQVRMGIHTGRASIGNFGSRTRMDYTAIGRHVNLAIQLQGHALPGGILVSHATRVLLPERLPLVPAGELDVEGFERSVLVYAVDRAALEASDG